MDEKLEEVVSKEEKKTGMSPKIFLFGLPIFILQLIVVYFVTANVLLNRDVSHNVPPDSSSTHETEDTSEEEIDSTLIGHFIFPMDDVIVNPADTKGQRLMLISLGFDVALEEQIPLLEEKSIIIKDMLITTLAKKRLSELSNINYKDTLKVELIKSVKELVPEIHLNNIYFSKYIIN